MTARDFSDVREFRSAAEGEKSIRFAVPLLRCEVVCQLLSSETRKNIEFELPRPRTVHQNFKPRSKRTEMHRQQRKPWFEGHFSRGKSTDFKNFAPAARSKASRRHFALIFGQKRPRGPRGCWISCRPRPATENECGTATICSFSTPVSQQSDPGGAGTPSSARGVAAGVMHQCIATARAPSLSL